MDQMVSSQAANPHASAGAGAPRGLWASIRLAFRFALREMRGGLRGFYIFLACIALGVAAIGGVGSASKALTGGLNEQGRQIMGGDFSLSATHIPATKEQKAFLSQFGQLGQVASLRAMARTADASGQHC